ncbi:MAG: hypothetical protein M3Y55_06640 [Pseudomonadota bacterium]|nr:hypothetical protein [Pseudomonadota bacterium]
MTPQEQKDFIQQTFEMIASLSDAQSKGIIVVQQFLQGAIVAPVPPPRGLGAFKMALEATRERIDLFLPKFPASTGGH